MSRHILLKRRGFYVRRAAGYVVDTGVRECREPNRGRFAIRECPKGYRKLDVIRSADSYAAAFRLSLHLDIGSVKSDQRMLYDGMKFVKSRREVFQRK